MRSQAAAEEREPFSPLILAAQHRLLQLRQRAHSRAAAGYERQSDAVHIDPSTRLSRRLGQGSVVPASAFSGKEEKQEQQNSHSQNKSIFSSNSPPLSMKIFEHTLDTIHHSKKDGRGRLWLLLRFLDQAGEGQLPTKMAKTSIYTPDAPTYCLSKRRFDQILSAGNSLFWQKSKDGRWIYIRSEIKVARALGIRQIQGVALELPIVELTSPIKKVRALFYDAFHSGRSDTFSDR